MCSQRDRSGYCSRNSRSSGSKRGSLYEQRGPHGRARNRELVAVDAVVGVDPYLHRLAGNIFEMQDHGRRQASLAQRLSAITNCSICVGRGSWRNRQQDNKYYSRRNAATRLLMDTLPSRNPIGSHRRSRVPHTIPGLRSLAFGTCAAKIGRLPVWASNLTIIMGSPRVPLERQAV